MYMYISAGLGTEPPIQLGSRFPAPPQQLDGPNRQRHYLRYLRPAIDYTTPMQANVPAWRLVQAIPPTPPFQRTKFSVEIGPL